MINYSTGTTMMIKIERVFTLQADVNNDSL
jgi:hypothetical protein